MSIRTILATPFLVAAFALPAYAQPGPQMVKKFGDWALYSYKSAGKTNCYALTTPQKSLPASVDHGDNFFLVAPKPSGSGFYPQAIMGYDLKGGSPMTVAVGDDKFPFTPKGTSGWTQSEGDDAAVVNAMKGGSSLTLNAVSARGTQTSYTYSLAGISAALQQVSRCR